MGYIKIYIRQYYKLIIHIQYNKNILFSYKLNKLKLKILFNKKLGKIIIQLLIIYIIN